MKPKTIYLDNQSTTPLDPRVLDAMLPYLTTHFGNPSSRTHTYGFKAEEAIINAKKQVAKLINCNYDELIIVSGATEANNLAIKGIVDFQKHNFMGTQKCKKNENGNNDIENVKNGNTVENVNEKDNSDSEDKKYIQEAQNDNHNSNLVTNQNLEEMHNVHNEDNDDRPHIITVQTEHKAVLDTLRNISDSVRVTYLPVLKTGVIDLERLKKEITPNTICVSVMGINNEIGTVQDINEIGKICKAKNVVLHVDAAQSIGKIPIDVKKSNIGMMSISSHKMYGPKGVGMLFVRKRPRIRIKAQTFGGGQERNLRSGTLPTALVVGLGKAAEIAMNEMKRDYQNVMEKGKKLYTTLKKNLNDIVNNSASFDDSIVMSITERMKNLRWYPGCLNISFPYVEGEGLLMKLKNIALSSGSACTSASLEPSYVLRALGQDDDLAHSSIRFGIGRFTTMKEIKRVAKETIEAVKKLREMSPLFEMVNEGVDIKSIKWSAG